MTVTVARHGNPSIDEEAVERLAEELEDSVRSLDASPAIFGIALNEALLQVQVHQALNPRGNRLPTWVATVSAMQVGTAAFAAAAAEEPIEARITDEMRTIQATGPQFYANAGNWLTTLWFVIICRDQARMDTMCQVPLDLLRASGAEGDEYVYHWVDSLQTYWREEPGLAEKLTAAIEMSHPDIATIAPRDLLQCILYPPIHLFYQFMRKDHEGFNQALAEALELHKAYWSREDRSEDIAGYLALGPLAMACLAHDAGIPIEVESEYLPIRLLDRSWLGEFDT
ncbi:immunity 49 family protein [Streptomyces sp. G7(2002)]|uniref:immunity 49 family protein n=1 Tax=Streptomyces sp. G7(2002) TaxID=2971798 RepID=UPI00237D9758|nr:immunity 49 family protein [Streptomyces sp. G7(2002)]WDT54126.1 immunity 49 family protein [Streptomyces sp. G7(2002)]